MSPQEEAIGQAIADRRLIQFHYSAGDSPGIRVVEPHQTGNNRKGHAALSAWFLRGRSDSQEGEGWREYLISCIHQVVILDEQFPGPRPGYKPDGGKLLHNVRFAL